MALKLLSQAVPKATNKVFKRKFVMLGRIISQWEQIMGEAMASRACPIKLRYFKKDGAKKPSAILEVSCTAADSTILHYQKELILDRMNRLFGDDWIADIKFVASGKLEKNRTKIPRKTLIQKENSVEEFNLKDIGDPELIEKLESLGNAILQESKS